MITLSKKITNLPQITLHMTRLYIKKNIQLAVDTDQSGGLWRPFSIFYKMDLCYFYLIILQFMIPSII